MVVCLGRWRGHQGACYDPGGARSWQRGGTHVLILLTVRWRLLPTWNCCCWQSSKTDIRVGLFLVLFKIRFSDFWDTLRQSSMDVHSWPRDKNWCKFESQGLHALSPKLSAVSPAPFISQKLFQNSQVSEPWAQNSYYRIHIKWKVHKSVKTNRHVPTNRNLYFHLFNLSNPTK